MIKEVRRLSAPRTKVLLGCVAVLCLAALVSGVGTVSGVDVAPFGPASNDSFIREFKRSVTLETDPEVLAQCGGNVSLTCGASAVNGDFTRATLYWVKRETEEELCSMVRGAVRSGAPCRRGASDHQLVLTLADVKPADQGEYICKLHSNLGVYRNSSHVKLQECPGRPKSHFSKDTSEMECSFDKVYPRATVHWFKGNVNVTDSATLDTQVDAGGLFHVRSTLPIPPGDESQAYNCSLWRPGAHTFQTMQFPGKAPLESSGSAVQQQWVLAALLLVSFMC